LEPSTPSWRVFDAPSGQAAPDPRDAAQGVDHGGPVGKPLAMAAMGAAILIGGLAVVVAMGSPSGTATGPADTSSAVEPGVGAGDGLVGTLVVDVTGAVVTPGVYRLGAGARVGDAIDAAGGFGPRVAAARVAAELNLAATLMDGQQIRVPSRDDPGGGAGDAGGAGGGGHGNQSALIDLNLATQAELESLPGIGPVTAGKILESRAGSPFRSVDDLRERGLVGEKTFDSLRALITVG